LDFDSHFHSRFDLGFGSDSDLDSAYVIGLDLSFLLEQQELLFSLQLLYLQL
jgi:hypothetical protein